MSVFESFLLLELLGQLEKSLSFLVVVAVLLKAFQNFLLTKLMGLHIVTVIWQWLSDWSHPWPPLHWGDQWIRRTVFMPGGKVIV